MASPVENIIVHNLAEFTSFSVSADKSILEWVDSEGHSTWQILELSFCILLG